LVEAQAARMLKATKASAKASHFFFIEISGGENGHYRSRAEDED
jgi:hypothetical protein